MTIDDVMNAIEKNREEKEKACSITISFRSLFVFLRENSCALNLLLNFSTKHRL